MAVELQESVAPIVAELVNYVVDSNPECFANYQTSEKTRERVWDLVRREKNEGLTEKEKAELDNYAQLEHLLRLAKAKARVKLALLSSV